MSIREALQNNLAQHRKCHFVKVIEALEKDDVVALEEAVEMIRNKTHDASKYGVNASWIVDALKAEGISIHRNTVAYHINRKCACG